MTKNWHKTKKRVAQIILVFFIAIEIALVLLPLYVTVNLSLKSSVEMNGPVLKPPTYVMWSNYSNSFLEMWKNLLNSVLVCSLSVLVLLFLATLVAFVITRFDFPFKRATYMFFIMLLAVPGVISLTPQFVLYTRLGLRNSWWSLIFQYGIGGLPGAIFLFCSFFSQYPKDIFDAASIDGAGPIRVYANICMPLSVTIIIIQPLGSFSGIYNDYMWPILMIDKSELQMIIPELTTLTQSLESGAGEPGIKYALYLLSGLPLIFITAFGLKYFINGDFASGMKL